MAVRVKRKGTQLREEGITKLITEYAQVKKMKAMWEGKEQELKGRVNSILDAYGEEDEKGNLWYTLPQPVGEFTRLYRQKRVSQVLDEAVAEAILTDLEPTDDADGLAETMWDQCTRTVTVIDEDAVLALAFQKEITEEQMAEMYEENVSYALYLK